MRQIQMLFRDNFFKRDEVFRLGFSDKGLSDSDMHDIVRHSVCTEIEEEYSMYLGTDYDVSHIEALWDLGYLPIEVKALPEGTTVPMGVPVLTIVNTKPEFFWLTNFLETLISNLLWKPMTSATIAHQYKKVLTKWVNKTDEVNVGFVNFQGHDFSMRGMDSIDATISSGLGHATSFLGSDSLPVIHGARKYYDETEFVIGGVPATEHSVMCAGNKGDELGTFRRLLNIYKDAPVLSVVSDTWDLWKVITEYLPALKEEILERPGKLVIRPDSGDPVDIICGDAWRVQGCTDAVRDKVGEGGLVYHYIDKKYYEVYTDNSTGEPYFTESNNVLPNEKGVIELLWDIFGGTVNEQGYKVLDSHIGAIYGDSITIERADEICKRLEDKGFASTNIVLGIGSFTYQFNTRDTFGFAMKATYVELDEHFLATSESVEYGTRTIGREIFKDPITDDGTKKSAKGLLRVEQTSDSIDEITYILKDQVSWEQEKGGLLQTIFKDGEFSNQVTLTEIREKINKIV